MSTTDSTFTIVGKGADARAAPARTDEYATRKQEWWRFAARPLYLASGFSALAVISAASIVFVAMTKSSSELVTHTLQVENQLSSLQLLIRTAEGGERGYLLSGERGYLKDFKDAAETITPTLADLKQMTADNPVQQHAVAELAPLIAQRIDKMHEVTRLHDTGNAAAAVALIRAGHGRVLMEDIRAIIARMTDEEHRLLALRTSNASRDNILLLIVNLAGIALMIALAAVSIITVRRMGEEALRDSEKRGDELQAAVNELDAFSYSVSHDLRTPLRAIDGFSRILLKHHATELAPEPREYLQAVRDNAVQMGHLVDDLLAFARLNRKQLTKQQVPTKSIIEQVLLTAQQRAEGRCVTVSVGDLPPIWGDSALLKQVFVNLIDNAFKYTRRHADAAVEIGTRELGDEQVFFVRDNGVGFDMKYASQLFGVFQRLHRAEDFEGTGVGLAIVQRIIERHGGRIWAEAAVDKGATFFFTTEAQNHA
jgi:signal transduction histidine kinase